MSFDVYGKDLARVEDERNKLTIGGKVGQQGLQIWEMILARVQSLVTLST